MAFLIRGLREEDDIADITAMLHRAYAPLAERNLRFTATHQTPDVTRERFSTGKPLIAECEGRVVGTATVYRPDPASGVPLYREPGICHFGQFGVDPEFKGRGIGKALHEEIIAFARKEGACGMSLDTAAPAADLIAMYQRWGYEIVDRTKFSTVNYESVIMCLRWGLRNEDS